jgi:catechol 2,3-dioxygenase-like lactoylglutathione lyase family enzyme
MPTIVHYEIPADDVERAKKFYSDLFGWKMEKWPGADKKDDSFSMVCASRSDIELNIMPHTLHLYCCLCCHFTQNIMLVLFRN